MFEPNSNISFNSFIKVYDNTLTEQFCKSVCQKLDEDSRKKLGVFGGSDKSDPDIKSSLDLKISKFPEWKEEDEIFFITMSQFLKKYQDDIQTDNNSGRFSFSYGNDFFADTGYLVKVYKPGGHYDWHQDYTIHPYYGVRELTFIWYLNDNFDEGETEFCNGKKITPKTGRLVIFPSNWMFVHRGCRVKKNNKYIATAWYYHQRMENKDMIDSILNKNN